MKINKKRSDLRNIFLFLQILHRQNKIKKATDLISIMRTNSLASDGEYQITVQDGNDTFTYTSHTCTTWFSVKEFWVVCALFGGVALYILFSEMYPQIPKTLYIAPALILFALSEGVFFIGKIQKKYLPKDLREKEISIVNIIRNDHADMTTPYKGEYTNKNEYFSCSWNKHPLRTNIFSKQKL